ncbi:hypothetical protein LKD70_09225 [Ruminococcus sp. CLA-AA-H200]|uniref:Uncharacterized protein n=1 Tax=Ruminococcus turbiniformis TaxID=2881258 RepID=A0ABS8FXA0_9FIRM|nr:hypothetical protein [Ruminococcus turbiniformis]MCC2254596.1 hypothetical protein [Ruminococcus turbiniformis]
MKNTNPRQMSCHVNNKAVIELINKLQYPQAGKGSFLHRKARTEKDKNGQYLPASLIGINVVNYSVKPSVFVQENITPSELKELYYEAILKRNNYQFSGNGQKIFGPVDKDGYATARSIQICRQGSFKQGDQLITKNYPWTVTIQNGKGIKEINKNTGGTKIKSGSFVCEKKASINLSDGDFFTFLDEAVTYLLAWENYISHSYIKANEEAIRTFEKEKALDRRKSEI